MTSGAFSESSTIQRALLSLLVDLGWSYASAADLARTPDGVLVEPDLVAALRLLNPTLSRGADRTEEIIPRLRSLVLGVPERGLVGANEAMAPWLRGQGSVKFIGAQRTTPIRVMDFDDPRANRLVVSDEVTFGYAPHARRFDLVLWVNGIPLVVGETKSPVKSSVSWLNAAKDVGDVYERECAPFFVPNVFSFATEGRELHYGAVEQPPEQWLQWGATTDPLDLEGWPRVKRSVELLLTPERILSILRDFTLFERKRVVGRTARVKLIPRYPQVEGAEAIHLRVLDTDRRQGLIWHHQGTGKTLLMAFAALRLLNDERVGGPTVVIVLDRVDLVEQTVRQFQTAGLPRMRVAGSKGDLGSMLAEDIRGIVVTTIFKFEGAGFLNDRENIVVLIDEAHRTQEGTLGHDLRTALPNARFFGLTGTPISEGERNTFRLFGDPDDPSWVMSHYSVERSIADGASVPIHVETRLVDFHIDRAALDEAFGAMATEEGLDDDEREKLADRASHARTIVRNPERIRAVCADIVDHYFRKVAPLGLKAQVVAFDRELCVLYHDEITRLLAERGVADEAHAAVVMTVGTTKSEPPEWRERFALESSQEADVKARFCDPGDPLRFLIVTAKLLTGFDAPVEGAMYLDKALRLHTLFQAICRTNRRWTNPVTGQEKRFGLIVDYVGLGNEIGKALRAADPERGGRRPVDVDGLFVEVEAALEKALARFVGIDQGAGDMESLFAAQERLPPGQERDGFARDFTAVQTLWEFLHPDERLRPSVSDYRWLAQVYESVRPTGVSDALLWARLGAKTLELVHGHITEVRVTDTGLEEVIVDAETIEAIRQLSLPDVDDGHDQGPVTVGEALDTIAARIRRRLESTGGHGVYVELSERLERLRRHQLDRAQSSVDFLRELLELAREVTRIERADDGGRLDEPGLLPDANVGALTQILAEYAPDQTPEFVRNVAADIDAIVRQVRFTGWADSQPGDREVRKAVRTVLRKHALPTTGDVFDRSYAYVRENY